MFDNSQTQPTQFSPSTEDFGNSLHSSERFGNVPHQAVRFGNDRKVSERKEAHSITVREATRLFEAAGVARTERSIVNWCQPNRMGVQRLDAYYDPNERRYLITRQSIDHVISEELAKAQREGGEMAPDSRMQIPRREEALRDEKPRSEKAEADEVRELKQEVMDLRITNRAKDLFIDQLQKERAGFTLEREGYVEKLMNYNRQVGELQAKLLQLDQPTQRRLDVRSVAEEEIISNSRE